MSYLMKSGAILLPALCVPFCISTAAVAADNTLIALAPVVVTATRQAARSDEVLSDVTVIDKEIVEQTAQGTVFDLLARQPGVQVSNNGTPGNASAIYLRGSNSNQTKVLLDGQPINSLDLSGSPLRFIPLSSVDHIEILRGPASALYGADALGGVIQIFTKQAKNRQAGLGGDAFLGLGTLNERQAHVGVGGGNEFWRVQIEANHRYSKGFSANRYAINQDGDKDAYENNGGAFSFAFLPTKGHELGGSFRENQGKVHYDAYGLPASGNYDAKNEFTVRNWQIFSNNRFVENWTSHLLYSESEDQQTNYSWDDFAFPVATELKTNTQSKLQQWSWQNDIALPLGNLIALAEYQRQQGKFDVPNVPVLDNTSAMLGWNARWNRFSWQLSARHDKHSKYGKNDTYAMAYGLQIADNWRVNTSYGTAFRAPSLYDLFYENSAFLYSSNPDLKSEKSRNSEIGVVWETKTQTASAVIYRNKVRDLITFVSNPFTFEGRLENLNRARLQGLTFSYSAALEDWGIQASYDYLDAKNEETGKKLGRRARHKASFAINRHIGAFDVGAEVIAVGPRFDDSREVNRLSAYTLTNLTARYRISRDWQIEGRVNNLFDKRYEEALVGVGSGGKYYPYNTPGINAFVGLRWQLR